VGGEENQRVRRGEEEKDRLKKSQKGKLKRTRTLQKKKMQENQKAGVQRGAGLKGGKGAMKENASKKKAKMPGGRRGARGCTREGS